MDGPKKPMSSMSASVPVCMATMASPLPSSPSTTRT